MQGKPDSVIVTDSVPLGDGFSAYLKKSLDRPHDRARLCRGDPAAGDGGLAIGTRGTLICAVSSAAQAGLLTSHIKEIPVVRKRQESRRQLLAAFAIDFRHALDQMLDDDPSILMSVGRKVGMLERVHIQVHGVPAAVGLKDARHCARCGRRKVSIDQKPRGAALLQTEAGTQRAQVLLAGAGPIARPPAVDQSARRGNAPLLIVLDQGHAVLTRIFDVRQRCIRHRPSKSSSARRLRHRL